MGTPMKTKIRKAISFVLAVAVMVTVFVGLNGVRTKAAAQPMALANVEVGNASTVITPFETRTTAYIYVALDNPKKGNTLTIDIDERLFVNNTSFTAGPSKTVNVTFSKSGNQMSLTMAKDLNTSALVSKDEVYYLKLSIPVVYNKMETRISSEPQYQQKNLVFTEKGTGAKVTASAQVEHKIYDLSQKADEYLLTSAQKMYYDSKGCIRIRINTFYNYGHNTFQPVSYVRLDHNWGNMYPHNFVMDADITTVKHVYNSLDSMGKVITDPKLPVDAKQIWIGKTHFDGYDDEISGSFRKDINSGWYMESEKGHPIQGYEGGFKGTRLKASDPLLVEFEIFVNPKASFDYTKKYCVSAILIGKYKSTAGMDTFDASKSGYLGYEGLTRYACFVFPTPGCGETVIEKKITITEEFVNEAGVQLQAPIVTTFTSTGAVSYTQTTPPVFAGYDYTGYRINGGPLQSGTYTSSNITQSVTITAVYASNQFTVTEKYQDIYGDEIRVSASSSVTRGDNYTSTAPVIPGFTVSSYSIDGGTSIPGGTASIPNVQANHAITYVYEVSDITSDIHDIWYYYSDVNEDQYFFTVDDYLISNITPGTTVDQFLDNLVYDAGEVQILDLNGNDITNNDTQKVGSGMLVRHTYNGHLIKEFYIVIFGDVNGDGSITQDDPDVLSDVIAGTGAILMNPGQGVASNVTRDYEGVLDANDTALLQDYVYGSGSISQKELKP